MFGSTIVMKAAKKGYKRYGVPGAVVAGLGAFFGIRYIKRRFLSGGGNDTDSGTDTTTTTDSETSTDAESSST